MESHDIQKLDESIVKSKSTKTNCAPTSIQYVEQEMPMAIDDTDNTDHTLDDSQGSMKLVIDETLTAEEEDKLLVENNAKSLSKNNDSIAEELNNLDESGGEWQVQYVEISPMPIIEIDDDEESEENKIPGGSTNKVNKNEICNKSEENIVHENVESFGNIDKVTQVQSVNIQDDLCTDQFNNIDDDIFLNMECINYQCSHSHKEFVKAPLFALSYFKVHKSKYKTQYICLECCENALFVYEKLCGILKINQPLLLVDIPIGRQEFVEIIDSSDEEYDNVSEQKSDFSSNNLTLIEAELDNAIEKVLTDINIQAQMTWARTILSERMKNLQINVDQIDKEIRVLQKTSERIHTELYQCPKIKLRHVQPLDLKMDYIISNDIELISHIPQIPPIGEVERPVIQLNETYYVVKNNAIARWVPCKVIELVDSLLTGQKNIKQYKIKFLKSPYQMVKIAPANHLAYYEAPSVCLPLGSRVIAYFNASSLSRGSNKINVQSAFYPGVVAEPLKASNKFRYLIFYDDGYTQYVHHKDVRLVCHVSENVWDDVHPASREYICKYLKEYEINRPMVQTQKGQSMTTQSNGHWTQARVVDVDCSLVLMQFEGARSHTEWIYRGSLRLGPVFKEYQKLMRNTSNPPVSRLPRRTEPFIRYTDDEKSSQQRTVARKSFPILDSNDNQFISNSIIHSIPQQPVRHLNNSTIYVEDENRPKGKVVYYTAKRNLPPRIYEPHKCSSSCLYHIPHNLSPYSPLSKPLLSGWERFIIHQKIKKSIAYRTPCGKVLRNMKELHHYLRITENVLNVDNFDFCVDTNCLAEYVIESVIVQKRDISGGQEKMPIPLVNYYDNSLPQECEYSAKVIPTEGVHINTDVEFLVGCDCIDDCSDKSKCSCWQLTLAGAKYGNPNTPIDQVGYQYKRLLEHVPTGIYECNPRCKCKSNCLNRVVQHSLEMKLQVFKTSNRGWGLRCINDIPRGSFVCIYAGHLLTEAKANEGGLDAGDEYFAELDYIEVAEQIKDGYESDVVSPTETERKEYSDPEYDTVFLRSKSDRFRRGTKSFVNRSIDQHQSDDDFQERQAINFDPNADLYEEPINESSIRKLFGVDEACYVMDAKITGNLGRYFNHSCSPNLFVQNVFVDTHDLRFPWVAFFSSRHIRAGSELTWNYNYEVGVVPGKVLYCQCGASNCRLRLL